MTPPAGDKPAGSASFDHHTGTTPVNIHNGTGWRNPDGGSWLANRLATVAKLGRKDGGNGC